MSSSLSGASLVLHQQIHSPHLEVDRDLIVWLPPDYGKQLDRRYPVCYLQDGQNLFDPATAFLHNHWALAEILEELIESRAIQPLIIVGIYNAGVRRREEYTHVPDENRAGGLAQHYSRALLSDFKPLIDAHYRTLKGPAHTALGGSSLGGLVSAYIGLLHPEVFGNLIVMSPSVWWAKRDIVQQVHRHGFNANQKIWLDVGTSEGSDPEESLREVRMLRDAYIHEGWTEGENLVYVEEEGGEHTEKAWGQRMRDALRFLFPFL